MQAGESQVWSAYSLYVPKMGVARVIGTWLGLLILWGFFSLDGGTGVVLGFLIFAGGLYLLYKRANAYKKNLPQFVLTNKRAMVFKKKKVAQSCELRNCSVSVMNKTFRAGTSEGLVVGDVLFREQGQYRVVFREVGDPDGVMMTANQLISEQGTQA